MRILYLLFFLVLGHLVSAQVNLELYQRKLFISEGDTLPYRILRPENYDPARSYPILLFLHGAGERGNDNQLQLVHGARHFLDPYVRKTYPAFVVFPQCPKDSYWSNLKTRNTGTGQREFYFDASQEPTIAMELLKRLFISLMNEYPIDNSHMVVGGLSMGGMGTFELVNRLPNYFVSAFSICGGGDTSTAPVLAKTRWWVFHGGKDDVVPPRYSEEMVEALKRYHADVRYTLYPEANHNSWDPAFAEKDFMRWIFQAVK